VADETETVEEREIFVVKSGGSGLGHDTVNI